MSNKLKTIPLCQLKRSGANIRKTDRLAEIEQLAASIAANGLLENLIVQQFRNGSDDDPSYEVVAGGRRLAALKLLAKRKKLPRDHRIPCLVLSHGNGAVEASLAENFIRIPPHPADQFEAFAALARQGLVPDDIAARFGITPAFVQQRLKLAQVSPRLVAEYRAGGMTLDQLTAFTLADDHKQQEEVWFERGYADVPAHAIRRMLTSAHIPASDPRARFIGATAFAAAGGVILRDLFDSDNEGHFTDSCLLDRLVFEKLQEAAQPVLAEGWSWVEVRPNLASSELSRLGRARAVQSQRTEKDAARLSALGERYDELVAALEDGDESLGEEIDRISNEIAQLESTSVSWPQEEKARAGAIISLGHDGTVDVVRGLLRPEASEAAEATTEAHTLKKASNGYANSVILDLSAHRTAAIRELVAQQPPVALLALLFALVENLFYPHGGTAFLRVTASPVSPEAVSGTVAESTAGRSFSARQAAWAARLPERERLWDWLTELPTGERERLLAHCVGITVDALNNRNHHDADLAQVNRLAVALGLDMRMWWRPTLANFLDRVTKKEILAAVSEGVSQQASWRLAGFKKDRMAKEAEKLLAASAWLPAPLRLPVPITDFPSEQ